jgi:hypothetical protein
LLANDTDSNGNPSSLSITGVSNPSPAPSATVGYNYRVGTALVHAPGRCAVDLGGTAAQRAIGIGIRSGFAEFMRVAEALSEIRRRRLYREYYVGFADYVRNEFALALSSANSIINSFDLAQDLIADGVKLPQDTTPTVVRPLAMLPDSEGLRTSCWQFVQSLSPSRCPSTTLVSRVARLIRAELVVAEETEEEESSNDSGFKGRPCGGPFPPPAPRHSFTALRASR